MPTKKKFVLKPMQKKAAKNVIAELDRHRQNGRLLLSLLPYTMPNTDLTKLLPNASPGFKSLLSNPDVKEILVGKIFDSILTSITTNKKR